MSHSHGASAGERLASRASVSGPSLRSTETDQVSAKRLNSRVAVVGGGFLGMFLALRLRQMGAEVTLFESAPRVGGLAESDQIGGYSWDRFYHVILLSDLHTRALLEELGLAGALRWGVTRTGFYTDGKL